MSLLVCYQYSLSIAQSNPIKSSNIPAMMSLLSSPIACRFTYSAFSEEWEARFVASLLNRMPRNSRGAGAMERKSRGERLRTVEISELETFGRPAYCLHAQDFGNSCSRDAQRYTALRLRGRRTATADNGWLTGGGYRRHEGRR